MTDPSGTTPAQKSSTRYIVAVSAVTAVLLTLISNAPDTMCIPEYLNEGPTGKFTGVLRQIEYAVRFPAGPILLLIGYGVMAVCVACAPFLFPPKSKGFLTASLGPMILILGGVIWAVLHIPTAGCDGGWNGGRIMLDLATAVVFWLVLILIVFRGDRNGAAPAG